VQNPGRSLTEMRMSLTGGGGLATQ